MKLICFVVLTLSLADCAAFNGFLSDDSDDPSAAQRESRAEKLERQSELENQRKMAVENAIQSREIILGMKPEDVKSVWGDPRKVDVAGDSGSGNERWTYYEGFSSTAWAVSPTRVVYFESGQVVGWQTEQPGR